MSIERLMALPIEELEAMNDASAIDFVPQTETAPGMTEEGTIADASANTMPTPDPMSSSPEQEPITGGIDTADRRRQAVLNRIQNLRDAQDSQQGLV